MLYNTATRDVLAAAWGDIYDGGTLELRSSGGTTLLATITLPVTAFGAPATGVIAKAGTWSATVATSGTALVGRLISSDTLKVTEFTVNTTGGELNLDDNVLVAGGTATVSTFTYTVPAS